MFLRNTTLEISTIVY